MELLAAPPAELAAIADPSARGAAPLLDPAGAGSRGPPPAVPFALLLGLLAERLPAGESWPAGGKKLPLLQLDGAFETATPNGAFASLAPAASQLAGALVGRGPSPVSADAATPVSGDAATASLRAAAGPATVVRTVPPLPPLAGAEQSPPAIAARQPLSAELAAPAAILPAVPEILEAPVSPSPDSAATTTTEPEGFEHWFSADARVRAQLASTAAAEPRAGAPFAAPATAAATNVPAALLDAHASSAREKLPPQPGAARALDALAALTASAAATEAPTGLASDSLLAGHAQVHGTSGTAGTAAAQTPAPALPSAPVDARLPDWQEAFAQRVQWLVNTDAGEARIKLNPPELGAVDVKISLVDDKTHVHLTASTAAARDELAQSLPRLRELFTVSGLELGSASVHDGRGEHAGRSGQHAHGADAVPRDDAGAPLARLLDDPAVARHGVPRGRIDIFA